MAADGTAGHISTYNSDLKKMNRFNTSADKVGTPAIISDKNWADKRLSELSDAITAASQKADELRKKALQELGFIN